MYMHDYVTIWLVYTYLYVYVHICLYVQYMPVSICIIGWRHDLCIKFSIISECPTFLCVILIHLCYTVIFNTYGCRDSLSATLYQALLRVKQLFSGFRPALSCLILNIRSSIDKNLWHTDIMCFGPLFYPRDMLPSCGRQLYSRSNTWRFPLMKQAIVLYIDRGLLNIEM